MTTALTVVPTAGISASGSSAPRAQVRSGWSMQMPDLSTATILSVPTIVRGPARSRRQAAMTPHPARRRTATARTAEIVRACRRQAATRDAEGKDIVNLEVVVPSRLLAVGNLRPCALRAPVLVHR